MELKEKLVALRKEKGLTQSAVAEKLDVSRQAISRWESGIALPSTDNLKSLSALYGVPIDYLLNSDVERERDQVQTDMHCGEQAIPQRKDKRKRVIIGLAILLLVAIVVLAFTKERSKQDILIEEMEEEKVDTSPEGDFISMVKKGGTKVRLRKYFCMVLALMLVASCLCINGGATEITGQMETPIIMRASGKFEMDIPGHKLVKAKTSFPLEAGEQVTIKASYSPFDANVDFGLITEDGVFHFLSVDSGSFDRTITVSERGNYTFAVRNNSSKTINVSGYVNY